MKQLGMLMVLVTAGCATSAHRPTIGAAASDAIANQFNSPSRPVFLSDPASCVSETLDGLETISRTELEAGAIGDRLGSGVFVLCKASQSDEMAKSHFQRLLPRGGTWLIAADGEISLNRDKGGWKVSRIDQTAIEY